MVIIMPLIGHLSGSSKLPRHFRVPPPFVFAMRASGSVVNGGQLPKMHQVRIHIVSQIAVKFAFTVSEPIARTNGS
jgi:hypothetical protein